MEELDNFSTWCHIVGSEYAAKLQQLIEDSYARLRVHCHVEKWHAMSVTVATVVKDDEVVHIMTAQLVKVDYLQKQQMRQQLQGGLHRA